MVVYSENVNTLAASFTNYLQQVTISKAQYICQRASRANNERMRPHIHCSEIRDTILSSSLPRLIENNINSFMIVVSRDSTHSTQKHARWLSSRIAVSMT